MVSRKRSKKKNKGEEIALVVGGVVVLAVVLFVVLGTGLLKAGNCCTSAGANYYPDSTQHSLTSNVFNCSKKKQGNKWKVGLCKAATSQ
jgi:hypothetical protein